MVNAPKYRIDLNPQAYDLISAQSLLSGRTRKDLICELILKHCDEKARRMVELMHENENMQTSHPQTTQTPQESTLLEPKEPKQRLHKTHLSKDPIAQQKIRERWDNAKINNEKITYTDIANEFGYTRETISSFIKDYESSKEQPST